MTLLLAQFWPYLVAAAAVLLAIGKAFLMGKRSKENELLAKGAKARDQNIKEVRRARDAAAAVKPDDSVLDDPRNRDNRV